MPNFKILEENYGNRFLLPYSANELVSDQGLFIEIQAEMQRFVQAYVKISQKYAIAELIGRDLIEYTDIDMNCLLLGEHDRLVDAENISCFPRFESLRFNRPLYTFEATKLTLLSSKGVKIENYIYDLHGMKTLKEYIPTSVVGRAVINRFATTFSRRFYLSNSVRKDSALMNEKPIYFDIGVGSKLFFSGSTGTNSHAWLNTPRYNSFIRSLRHLWVEEFGWEVAWIGGPLVSIQGNHFPFKETPNGILLDGRLIYQEDIDEGRVQLPE